MDTSASPSPSPVKTPRVLADGQDLTGTTTLTLAMAGALAGRGIPAGKGTPS